MKIKPEVLFYPGFAEIVWFKCGNDDPVIIGTISFRGNKYIKDKFGWKKLADSLLEAMKAIGI